MTIPDEPRWRQWTVALVEAARDFQDVGVVVGLLYQEIGELPDDRQRSEAIAYLLAALAHAAGNSLNALGFVDPHAAVALMEDWKSEAKAPDPPA